MFRNDPAPLNLRVRCLFEENLQNLAFPKVKEFVFRINLQSPIEVAARALAKKNGHIPGQNGIKPNEECWRRYSFLHIDR